MKLPKILISRIIRYKKAGKLFHFFTKVEYEKNRIPVNVNLSLDMT
jgi:hypothetical protein